MTKRQIYWRTLSPWLIIPAALLVMPFIIAYMWIRYPKKCIEAWKRSKEYY